MLTRLLSGYISRHRHLMFSRKVDQIARRLHEAYENLNYNFYSNGEQRVLEILKEQCRAKTILDVGANVGKWTTMASHMFPDSQIESFEPVPETYRLLARNCSDFKNVTVHRCGLSDAPGTIPIFYSAAKSGLATCVAGFTEQFHGFQPAAVAAEVTSGDAFCSGRGIHSIDVLKIDVEGYERNVLQGFVEMLANGAIEVIQFEYGYANIASRFLLKDVYELLTSYGMRIGKIYPRYVEFKEYTYQDENFLGPNYLAVKQSLPLVIEALGQ